MMRAMKRRGALAALLLAPLCTLACTSIAVGKDASTNGSPMVTHSDDSGGAADIRIVRVPAKDHPPGSVRNVYLSVGTFPRLIAPERAAEYSREALPAGHVLEEERYVPLGTVPQVSHTFGYIDADYGMANEVGLVIGESTCSSKLGAAPRGVNNGSALFGIEELSKLALERCATARCAIQTMGEMAVAHGYYGGAAAYGTKYGEPSPPPKDAPPVASAGSLPSSPVLWEGREQSEAGEALTLADRAGEAWVFHISPDDTGTSAVWAAQRVRDDEVAVVANNFVIRACEDGPDFCMRSPNAVAVARRAGFYGKQAASPPLSPPSAKSGGEAAEEGAPLPAKEYLGDAEAGAPMEAEPPFDFTAAFGYEPSDLGDLEVNRYYTGRRLWRVFDLLAPSLELDPAAGHIPTRPAYPFSVRPERKVSASRLVAIHRDHYEGTPYDLTRGLASGPFGTPNRYAGARKGGVKGAWERAISMHRSLFAFVAVAGRPPAEQGADDQEGGERQQAQRAQQRQQGHEHGDDRKRAGLETVVWFGADTPHASFFSPLLPAVEVVPSALSQANEAVFDPTVSAWWAVNPVKYVMDLNYRYMQPFVRAQPHAQLRLAVLCLAVSEAQAVWEKAAAHTAAQLEEAVAAARAQPNATARAAALASVSAGVEAHWAEGVSRWNDLFGQMMLRFRSGYLNRVVQPGSNIEISIAYPDWWLASVGYDRFPQPPALVAVSQQVRLPPYQPPQLVPVQPGQGADGGVGSLDSATGGQAAIPVEPTPPDTAEPPTLVLLSSAAPASAAHRAQSNALSAIAWTGPFVAGVAVGIAAAVIAAMAAGGARTAWSSVRRGSRVCAGASEGGAGAAYRVPLVADAEGAI